MRSLPAQIEWSWNDGWLLMAMFLAQGDTGARLHELIGAADATNHAIPTAGELSSAFTKFVRCGLVTVAGDRFVLSPQHLPVIRKAYRGRGGLFAAGDKGLKWLRRSGLIVTGSTERVGFSEARVKSAYEEYISALQSK